ncbi:MAG: hypothetical protein JRN26_03780 [Nitrososphaerota archaeon]|jgi:ribosomal protein L31E|nr:hypothetical protein [Nitrososphaerota archaeon]MDG6927635.1 hypothetical protein [Nitrososphaerota archaeon]MDG6931382.1 hypothetical protein [Nitrososphaerota archaeon]MDG6931592.1 hypothetical protein [Nitrososphaerota archaeon]MDG6935991.1 hypothetical protein [Nitrososphaerota archaeon]
MTEEKTITISFSRIFYKQYYQRSNKAIEYLKSKIKKMTKVDRVIITNDLNAEIWGRGQNLNIRRIKMKVTIDEENSQATADVFEHPKPKEQPQSASAGQS